MNNPLVVQPVDSTAAYSGAGILDTALTLSADIGDGSWAAAGLGVAALAIDGVALAVDPIGTLLAAGFGWVLEHVPPLPAMLDALAGAPDLVDSYAKTWLKAGEAVGRSADHFRQLLDAECAEWSGPAIGAYRLFADNEIQLVRAAAAASQGVGTLVSLAGAVVATVRCIVRDLIAECCAKVASYLIELAASACLAAPVVVAQISTTAAKYAAKVTGWFERLRTVIEKISGLLKRLNGVIGEIAPVLAKCGYTTKAPKSLPKLAEPKQLGRTVVKESAKYGSYQLNEANRLTSPSTAPEGQLQ